MDVVVAVSDVVPAVEVVVVDVVVVVGGGAEPFTVSAAEDEMPLQLIVKTVDTLGATDCDQSDDLLPDHAEYAGEALAVQGEVPFQITVE